MMKSMTHQDSFDEGDEPASDAVPAAADPQGASALAQMTMSQVEQQILVLPQDLSVGKLLLWLDLTAVLLSRAKLIRQMLEQIAVGWISTNGPITIGDIRYTIAHPSTVKCINVPLCLDQVMEACGGDIQVFCSYLAANPFKYGSVRQLLGQALFDQVFRVEVRPKLVEGTPQKQLVRKDQRFLR